MHIGIAIRTLIGRRWQSVIVLSTEIMYYFGGFKIFEVVWERPWEIIPTFVAVYGSQLSKLGGGSSATGQEIPFLSSHPPFPTWGNHFKDSPPPTPPHRQLWGFCGLCYLCPHPPPAIRRKATTPGLTPCWQVSLPHHSLPDGTRFCLFPDTKTTYLSLK